MGGKCSHERLHSASRVHFPWLAARQRLMTLHSEGWGLSLACLPPSPVPPTLLALQMKAECIYSPACRPAASGRGITLAMMNKRGLIQKQALAHPVTHSAHEQGSPRRQGILPRALFCFYPSVFFFLSITTSLRGAYCAVRSETNRASVVTLTANMEDLFAPQRFGFSVEFISTRSGVGTH